jgi:hypothetical protein
MVETSFESRPRARPDFRPTGRLDGLPPFDAPAELPFASGYQDAA